MKLNHVLIPGTVVAVAVGGSLITGAGMEWYRTLNLPSWTPPGSTIGLVWTSIFILSAIGLLLVFNGGHPRQALRPILWVALLNAALNVLWSLLFFGLHWLGVATIEAAALGLSVVWLMWRIWPCSRAAAALFAPYALWVAFATYLTHAVWRLNV